MRLAADSCAAPEPLPTAAPRSGEHPTGSFPRLHRSIAPPDHMGPLAAAPVRRGARQGDGAHPAQSSGDACRE
eukprot:CAMPEP_0177585670 /NCGR_PEP_ID=MMETSP0419_2-20121207/4629_1 /TAXON_ID=582737 /ORGANISM="Tetraselmis sp., Strain GSL018" /LENGTH=72 /DNA_ID=CAMNT_0019075443 /DNA_START=303 /DNA_END=519 /DNA_ORIENTATION=-